MTTRAVNKYASGFDVYIGRERAGMHYGNPFTHKRGTMADVLVSTREESVQAYCDWLRGDAHQDVEPSRRAWILENISRLKGKRLGCFCKPKACHGDVLAAFADEVPYKAPQQQTLNLSVPDDKAELPEADGQPEIHFNSRSGRWAPFSNMFLVDISDKNGDLWPSAEHMYQASKCRRRVDMQYIRCLGSSFEAKKYGRKVEMRSDWNETKLDVMRRIQYRKYSQNQVLRDKLLLTGDAILVEHAPWDDYWGNGGDGSGENWMGRILMDLRTELRKQIS